MNLAAKEFLAVVRSFGEMSAEEANRSLGSPVFDPSRKLIDGVQFGPGLRDCLISAPKDLDLHRTVAVVSSRRPRDFSTQSNWLDYLRTAMVRIAEDELPVLTAEGTTCNPFLQAGGDRFGLRIVNISVGSADIEQWLGVQRNLQNEVSVFPNIEKLQPDEVLTAIAKRIFVLAISHASGTADRIRNVLERNRLANEPSTVFLAADPGLVRDSIVNELVDCGAIRWQLFRPASDRTQDLKIADASRIWTVEDFERRIAGSGREFLFHCTRGSVGPWPGEKANDYYAGLLLGQVEDRSPLGTLMRIVIEKRIRAGRALNRSGCDVVSFTEHPLHKIRTMRVFRSHLARWDFEPFGVGICRQAATAEMGFRPVIYGTDQDFARLSEEVQPFFQLSKTVTKRGRVVCWSDEREWRKTGDVNLRQLSPEDIVLFVESLPDALRLRELVNWPIVVLYWPEHTAA